MKKLLRTTAAIVASAGLAIPGIAAAHNISVDTEGPNSPARVHLDRDYRTDVDLKNDLDFKNKNDQRAETGDATARNNTTVGDVGTGEAWVDNTLDASVSIDNTNAVSAALGGGGGGGDLEVDVSTQGPNSPARVNIDSDVRVDVDVKNDVDVYNSNYQRATSGDATARNNTTVGNVTTGDATAVNETSFELNISN